MSIEILVRSLILPVRLSLLLQEFSQFLSELDGARQLFDDPSIDQRQNQRRLFEIRVNLLGRRVNQLIQALAQVVHVVVRDDGDLEHFDTGEKRRLIDRLFDQGEILRLENEVLKIIGLKDRLFEFIVDGCLTVGGFGGRGEKHFLVGGRWR